MEPASSIIRKLGGPSVVAKIVGVHRTRVSNWMRPRESGGTGGRIPQDHHRALIDAATRAGLDISADDLLPTAPDRSPVPSSHGASA